MILLLVDGEIGPTKLDEQMLDWLRGERAPPHGDRDEARQGEAVAAREAQARARGEVHARARRRRVGERDQAHRRRPSPRSRPALALARLIARSEHPGRGGRHRRRRSCAGCSPSSCRTSRRSRSTRLTEGWDNVIYRLGDELTVRLPRRTMAAELVEHEQRWLPDLAPRLPAPDPGCPSGSAARHAAFPGRGASARGCRESSRNGCRPTIPSPPRRAWAGSSPPCTNRRPPTRRRIPFRGVPLADRDASDARKRRAARRRDRRARRVGALGRAASPPRRGAALRCGCTATCTRRTCSCTTAGCRP